MGHRDEAHRLVDELKRRQKTGYVPAAAFVNAYLGLGDNEQAMAWLERAYSEQSNILQWAKVHPYFDPLRGDHRFVDLLHRLGWTSLIRIRQLFLRAILENKIRKAFIVYFIVYLTKRAAMGPVTLTIKRRRRIEGQAGARRKFLNPQSRLEFSPSD